MIARIKQVLALLFLGALVACALPWFLHGEPDAAQTIQLADLEADTARGNAMADALAPFQTVALQVLLVAVPVGLLAVLGLRLWMWWDGYKRAQWQASLAYVDEETGVPAIPRALLESPEGAHLIALALQGYHAARVAEAGNTGTPTHFAPHTIYQVRDLPSAALASVPLLPQLAAPPAPTFADLRASGQIGPGRPLVLGHTADGLLLGDLKDWRSGAVAGLPGAGKTTTLRFIAGQAAVGGAQLAILDPHMHKGPDSLAGTLAPLAPAFLCDPVEKPKDMLQVLHLVKDILQRRLDGEPVEFPLFGFVDEFTSLMARGDLGPMLAEILEMIAQEGRASEVQGVISGQIWTAARAGGTALRDSLASTYVHRMKRGQAQVLLPVDAARRAETLATGAAVLWRASGELIDVTIPLTTAADIEEVGRGLARGPAGVQVASDLIDATASDWWDVLTDGKPTGPLMDAPEANRTPNGRLASAEAQRAVQLFLAGKDVPAIVEELRGIDPATGGRKYQAAARAIQQLIREGLGKAS